ncbi:MAG TPA: Ig-like domain repeat protein [Verrucomicrobiae bacterium]|nr:Ig-like domain repeat protein [Verrucomicrobiae bacterium]
MKSMFARIMSGKHFTGSLGLAALLSVSAMAQSSKPPIQLVQQDRSAPQLQLLPATERALLAKMPANFYHFGTDSPTSLRAPQTLTLRFSVNTQITKISTTPDFTVVQGGTCEAGRYYEADSTCQLLVEFTPRGPGHRLGKLAIAHTASAETTNLGLTGYGYSPVVSFVPSLIGTPSEMISGGVGVFKGAVNISIDSGDSLYVADTGNNRIVYIDSSATLNSIAKGYTSPVSVSTDPFGEVYFDLSGSGNIYEIYDYGLVILASGGGNDTCTTAAPCYLYQELPVSPAAMSTDGFGNIFFVDEHGGAAKSFSDGSGATVAWLYDPFPYQQNFVDAFAVDRNDNLYTFWGSANCTIQQQSLYNAANAIVAFTKVAGGRTCGFSGDGGQAGSAEISSHVGQMVFDLAGNLYFSDTGNNRVRRIDAQTGIIRTIAGNGTVGNSGDSGPATSAKLDQPTGIAVDSQGQVYITSLTSTTGTAESIRKVGVVGSLVFSSTTQGTTSTPMIVTVSNTGNSSLTINKETITGTNPSDFVIDNTTTSCNFSAGNYLDAGQTCYIGVAFKPGAVGSRTATLTLTDNSVTGSNKVKLTGTGVAPASVKFTSPSASQVLTPGTSVTLAVAVTSKTAPAPTGTVKFLVDGTQVGSAVTVTSGVASIAAGQLAAGTHAIKAEYSGDQYHHSTNANETITVGTK